ncbi:hypothetical protein FOMG_17933 [Fusarium oxysporum f. sp. melonis 26406]|uniref:Uncharacterized protein n=1 Tax=Fusarium oxysporum f. sp. melonis 26406 TaxID=1089452 RepID=W9Z0V1_FUSOX|nr:hypothetical protein FOMG_17933 [Fusarium oxysporum f. sp. melonis 26406]EXK25424.1 hypothetical protein FOMG_17933 [Fusarium oxysporum f. sp. melonis 26406]
MQQSLFRQVHLSHTLHQQTPRNRPCSTLWSNMPKSRWVVLTAIDPSSMLQIQQQKSDNKHNKLQAWFRATMTHQTPLAVCHVMRTTHV